MIVKGNITGECVNFNEQPIYKTNNRYTLRLLSDNELLAKADVVYDTSHTISKNHTLDSSFFGASSSDPICKICNQGMRECPGHYSVIQIPFPIVKAICMDHFKRLITMICPICAKLLLPNAKQALFLDPQLRLQWLKDAIVKYTKDGESVVKCPRCTRSVTTLKVLQNEPQLHIGMRTSKNTFDLINPMHTRMLMTLFDEVEEIGFSFNYHPRYFMTSLIPIVPNKLRPKTAQESESILMSYYKMIIETICPKLNAIFKVVTVKDKPSIEPWDPAGNTAFCQAYDKLMAYYMLVSDTSAERTKEACLNIIEKRDRTYFDKRNSLIGRFKGKDSSIFHKGIIDTRHNVSCRTVLGGATDVSIKNVAIPFHIAGKLSMSYSTYEENLRGMKQLVAAMSVMENVNNPYLPKVFGIRRCANGQFVAVNMKNATSLAATLLPGDKVDITLLNGDLIQQMRFPCIREESWTSMQVHKNNNSIVTIPLCVTKMKGADFDGDEAQVYVPSNHTLDIEELLLHSTYTMLLAYKDGNPAIWYSADAPYGVNQIRSGRTSYIYHDEPTGNKPVNIIEVLEKSLPKSLTYKDSKTCIVNGKFVEGKTELSNKELIKYVESVYGSMITEDIMDEVVQIAYDLNRDNGNTMGFDIRIYGTDVKKQIRRIVSETYERMKLLAQSNDPNREQKLLNASEEQKPKIKKLLIDAAKGSTIEKLGYLNTFQDEYYQMCVLPNQPLVNGDRPKAVLAEGARTNIAYPRFSIDPAAQGYSHFGYDSDILPETHFYDCMQERQGFFQRGSGTAKQGYMQKRMGVAFGSSYADFNGALVSNFRHISGQYGACGLNPRLYVQQPLIDISLNDKEFNAKYGSDKRLIECRNIILATRARYKVMTVFTKSEAIKDVFVAGFNYEQYINSRSKQGSTKNIDAFVSKLYEIFLPSGADQSVAINLIYHEYYFRTKLLNVNVDDKVLNGLLDFFAFSLVAGGDAVGMKASFACSEPLTQASLDAIHGSKRGGASTDAITRSAGLTRFEEIMTGTGKSAVESTVVTFKLYDDSREACIKFANEYEMFYYNAIWSRMELAVCGGKVLDKVCDLHPDLTQLRDTDVNAYYVVSIWNLSVVSGFDIHVTEIINALMRNFPEIMFITGYALNSSEFMAYIYFNQGVTYTTITSIMEEWGTERTSTIVHGKYLSRCFVSENANRPGHYLIEANEVTYAGKSSMALENLIFDERVDPLSCRSTKLSVIQKMFGIMETSARCIEELIYTATNLSHTSGVLVRHYKLIGDMLYSEGYPRHADRNKFINDRRMDAFRRINFEIAKNMIIDTVKNGDVFPVADPVSCSMFGELPTVGTGCSKITLVKRE